MKKKKHRRLRVAVATELDWPLRRHYEIAGGVQEYAEKHGDWELDVNGNNVKALFRDKSGQLRGFALTGDTVSEKMALQKELPPILE